jgi:hypothetical protein
METIEETSLYCNILINQLLGSAKTAASALESFRDLTYPLIQISVTDDLNRLGTVESL